MNIQAVLHTDLEKRVAKAALAIAPDYPGIKAAGPFVQLFAMEQCHEGTFAACRDCHKIIKRLQAELGWTDGQIEAAWKEVYQ